MEFTDDTAFQLLLSPIVGANLILKGDPVLGMAMIGWSPLLIPWGALALPSAIKSKLERYSRHVDAVAHKTEQEKEENATLSAAQIQTKEQEKERCKKAQQQCGGADYNQFRWFRRGFFGFA